MTKCRLILMSGTVLALLAIPASALPPTLQVDFYSEWLDAQPGWDDVFYVYGYGGWYNTSKTFDGITVTLNGQWGGRNRGLANIAPDNPPDWTESRLLVDIVFPYDAEPTITISGLEPNLAYTSSHWAWEQNNVVGFDLYANGVQVANDWRSTPVPTHNNDNRLDFEAVADSAGVVVLQYKDKLMYRLSALRMVPVPEPGTVVLLFGLMGLGLVCFTQRKK